MKTARTIIVILICLVCAASASALDAKFKWEPNTESDLAGYKVYYGIDGLDNPVNLDVKNQTVATVTGLDPGQNYSFVVAAYNTSGMEGPHSNVVTVLESVLPVVSISNPANNSNVMNSVAVTASASDNVGVTKVVFYVDGILKSTSSAAPYQYSWDTLSVATGTHAITTKAYDAAGNIGVATVSVNVLKDLTPPVISNMAPAQGSSVSGSVTVSCNASDDVGVTRVEFFVNGDIGAAVNTTPYNYVWDTTTVANGSYILIVKAYDAADNSSQSSVAITANNQDPDLTSPTLSTFSLPLTATSLTVPVSSLTATDSVGVTGYLITESATAPAASASGWTASAPTSYNFSAAGSRTAYAWAKDAAGNISVRRSATVTITLPDTTAPTVSITSPDNSSTVSGTVIVTATATDNVAVAKVELYINGVLTKTDTASPFSFIWNTTSIANGSYTLSFKAYDVSGYSKASTVTVTVSNKRSVIKKRGDLNGDGKINVTDALLTLRLSVGLTPQTVNPMEAGGATDDGLDGDVAPLDTSGAPLGNGVVNISDALVLLKYSVGLASW